MLTDIFAIRYGSTKLWQSFGQAERRLVLQTFRMIDDQLCPFYDSKGSADPVGKAFWKDLHDRVANELGLRSLAPLAYSFNTTYAGKQSTVSGSWPMISVCETWALRDIGPGEDPDQFIKERLSLVELAFRKRADADRMGSPPSRVETVSRSGVIRRPEGSLRQDWLEQSRQRRREIFDAAVSELNTRFRQSGAKLHYHSGFIQISDDEFIRDRVEEPFWSILQGDKWHNVDMDMKEAIDLRDGGGRDPAFYSVRALESVLKIISDDRGLTHGGERGAQSYIDNLASKRAAVLERWEADALKQLFKDIRNPLGHGPGAEKAPTFSPEQTDWIIHICMAWTRSLISRSSA